VLLFLADYQKWFDYFRFSGVEQLGNQRSEGMLRPGEADLLLACCDSLIAAQTAVIAAEIRGTIDGHPFGARSWPWGMVFICFQ
jgi:hypothetical protein